MMNNNCGYYGNKSRPGYAHSHSGSSLPQTQQPSSGATDTSLPATVLSRLSSRDSWKGNSTISLRKTKKVPSRRNSLSRDSDTYDMHASSGSRFVQTTMIDSVTAIPDDLYRRMESEANIDRGVHVPKKRTDNACCCIPEFTEDESLMGDGRSFCTKWLKRAAYSSTSSYRSFPVLLLQKAPPGGQNLRSILLYDLGPTSPRFEPCPEVVALKKMFAVG